MAITVKHNKVSLIPDAGDESLIEPSDWNADHTLTGLGTLAEQNANNVSITGGSIAGVTVTGYISTSEKAQPLGVATLDAGGKVPTSQIPMQGDLNYQGTWNALTNTPTLVSSTGTQGYYYVVSVAGTTNLDGITDWQIGDWAIYNGTAWQKVDNTDAVSSVNGQTGTVVLTQTDISGTVPTSRTITAGTGLSGGGDLTANRTLSIANTTVVAGTYGSASRVPVLTTNAQGQLTGVTNTDIAIANTAVSGLGTMSTQNANAVNITGGSLDGVTIGSFTAGSGEFTTLAAEGADFGAINLKGQMAFSGVVGHVGQVFTSAGPDELPTWTTPTVGTVTSVSATAGTGISITGSPITSSGTLNITNTAPDQTVAIASGTGISVTGTYPSFTVTNTAPSSGGTVTSITAGTGLTGGTITTSGTIAIDSTVVTTSGSYANPSWITSLDGSKITGTLDGGTF